MTHAERIGLDDHGHRIVELVRLVAAMLRRHDDPDRLDAAMMPGKLHDLLDAELGHRLDRLDDAHQGLGPSSFECGPDRFASGARMLDQEHHVIAGGDDCRPWDQNTGMAA